MKMEINKAFKRRIGREKKKQEAIDLAPTKALQPRSRTIRYDNMRSAVAEESILAQILKEPAMLEYAGELSSEDFSVELLGRAYRQLRERYRQGMEVSLAVLSDMNTEEMNHLTGVSQRQQGPVSEAAFRDCVRTVLAEKQSKTVASDEDLLAFRNKLKERKGTDQ